MSKTDSAILGLPSHPLFQQTLLRFRSSYIVTGSGCWEWLGFVNDRGYGNLGVTGVAVLAHRLAFFLANGHLPNVTDHLCRNRKCVNDLHLDDVDNKTNLLRGEGAPAKNAKKTKCFKGHDFYPIKGGRKCRTCQAEHNQIMIAKRKREQPVRTIAGRIDAHLKRIESDPTLNTRKDGRSRFYGACAWASGCWIGIQYVSYQGTSSLRRKEAEQYLEWLDAGNVGGHYQAIDDASKKEAVNG